MASPPSYEAKVEVVVEGIREISDEDLAITTPSTKESLDGHEKKEKNGGVARETEITQEDNDPDTPYYDFNSDEFKDIPDIVRNVVSFEDDPTQLVVTFRSVLLTSLFCIVGSAVSQISYFRTTTAPFPVFFVILASAPLGRLMARWLPDWKVPLGPWSFSLNPGPFTAKEHAIIGIGANAGSTGQWASFLPTNAALYYGITMSPAIALFFSWGAALLGFAFAAMVRTILVDDPEFVFPLSLQQVKVYRSMHEKWETHSKNSQKQMRIFWWILLGCFAWQFLPEFLFPFLGALAPLCWFASHNHKVNFLGAGAGGVGILNITLDWSNITSTVITYPYSVQVIIFVGFAITTWILIPIAYFGNIWGSPTYNIMSQHVFTKNGSAYPFTSLIYTDSQGRQVVNETKYEEVGLAYTGAQYTWEIFMWYASYISSYVWAALFLGPKLGKLWKARRNLNKFHKDRLSLLIQKYPTIKLWEWGVLTIVPIVILLAIVATDSVWMSTWTYFVALGFGAASMLPMSLIYATSGYSMKVGLFNELVYGYMIENSSNRHPLGQLAYRIISGNTWYDGSSVLEDQKIGHYLHLPPRQVIGMQIFAGIIATPVNYGIMRMAISSKYAYLTGEKTDPTGQWTGQDFVSYNTDGVQYALVGPKRIFSSSYYSPVLYGFLAGGVVPVLVWLLYKKFPLSRFRFNLWNTTIFFASAATFRGNLSTGPFTAILIGTFFNFYLYRYRHAFWNRWAYFIGAALDTGYNANLLFIFLFFGTTGTVMVKWWGNNAANVERCFALAS